MSLPRLEELLAEIQQRRASAQTQIETLGKIAVALSKGLNDPEIREALKNDADMMVTKARIVLNVLREWSDLPESQLIGLVEVAELINRVFEERVVDDLQGIGRECLGGYG